MRIQTLFLIFILTIQIGCEFAPVLAQENKDVLEIKKVLEAFVQDVSAGDINSAMQKISVNFSKTKEDKIIDYAQFKSAVENYILSISKTYVARSVGNVRIIELDIQDNRANLKMEHSWKGFNLDTLKEESGILKRIVALAKENGTWKITQWEREP